MNKFVTAMSICTQMHSCEAGKSHICDVKEQLLEFPSPDFLKLLPSLLLNDTYMRHTFK